jgi:hypothetical protein
MSTRPGKGHSRRFGPALAASGLPPTSDTPPDRSKRREGPKAAVEARSPDVGLSPDSGEIADIPQPPLGPLPEITERATQ